MSGFDFPEFDASVAQVRHGWAQQQAQAASQAHEAASQSLATGAMTQRLLDLARRVAGRAASTVPLDMEIYRSVDLNPVRAWLSSRRTEARGPYGRAWNLCDATPLYSASPDTYSPATSGLGLLQSGNLFTYAYLRSGTGIENVYLTTAGSFNVPHNITGFSIRRSHPAEATNDAVFHYLKMFVAKHGLQ